ncbi:MAG: hypothetical protein KDD15_29080 [Lewinella sp.]|nr:hypothetical protein [Lewinella sp.]
MTVAIDTDKAVQALTGVGFKKEQARVLIDQLLPAGDDLVTKDFLRAEIQTLESRLTARIYGGQIASVVAVVGALKFFGLF